MSGSKTPKNSHFKRRRRRGSYLGVTGKYPTTKNSHPLLFESLRERDLFVLLNFDGQVDAIEDHPVTIQYQDGKKARSYTPDTLARYVREGKALPRRRLIEVKMADQLQASKSEFEKPFEAARKYAAEHSMTFEVVTEVSLPRPKVRNLRFLYPYRRFKPNADTESAIRSALAQPRTLNELCAVLEDAGISRAQTIAYTWRLVANQAVSVDLDQPLSGDSLLEYKTWTISL